MEIKEANTILLYEEEARKNALWLAAYLRTHGLYVQAMKRGEDRSLKDYQEMGRQRGMRNLLYLKGEGRIVNSLDLVRDKSDQIPLSAYGQGPKEEGGGD